MDLIFFFGASGSYFFFFFFDFWASKQNKTIESAHEIWDYGTYHIGDQRRLRRAIHTHVIWKQTKGSTKYQTSSPTGWLCMRVWRMSLWRTKSTTVSLVGSINTNYHVEKEENFVILIDDFQFWKQLKVCFNWIWKSFHPNFFFLYFVRFFRGGWG